MILPSGFIKPCMPSKVSQPPSGSLWVHEIKQDGYRLMVRRDGLHLRCFTRNGNNWADHFPTIVEIALSIKARSFLIDGEAVFRGAEAVLFAFDLLELDGDYLRDLPLH